MNHRAHLAVVASAAALFASLVAVGPAASAAPADDDLLVSTNAGVIGLTGDGANRSAATEDPAYESAVAPDGDLWVTENQTVTRYPADGSEPTSFGGYSFPLGLAIDREGAVYVADYDQNGIFVEDGDPDTPPQQILVAPGVANLSLDSDDNLLFTNFSAGTASRAEDGVVTQLASGLASPVDLVQEASGSLIVTEQNSGQVKRITAGGAVTVLAQLGAGTFGATIGSDRTIYVANFGSGTIVAIDPDDGTVEVVASGFDGAFGLTSGAFGRATSVEQEITFTSDVPGDAVVDGPAYTPTATGGASDNPVTFSTTTPGTCDYDDEADEVLFVGAGTCTVAADQAGGTKDGVTYADAETVTQDITVGKGAQVITFAEGSPTEGSVGESFTPSATGGASDNPVTFSIDEDSTAVCEISDAQPPVVTYTAAGTCVVNADQAGDEDYEAAPTAPLSVAVDVAPTMLELVPSDEALTATVTSPEGAGTPVGEVVFTLDDEQLGTAELVANPDDPQEAVAVLRDADPGTSGLLEASYAGDDTTLGGSEDVYDRAAPTLQTTTTTDTPLNAAGWYRSPVTIGFVCTEGTAELVGDCPGDLSRANTNPGFRIDRTIVAADGGRASVDRPLRVDSAAPVLDIRRVGEPVYARTARPIRCSAVDGRSGLDGACEVTYGGIVAGPGGGARRVWTATATDVAGNTSSHSGSFRVSGPAPRVAGPGSR